MAIDKRDVFKMVALRGPVKGRTLDPSEFLKNSTALMNQLSNFEFSPSKPTEEVLRSLRGNRHLTKPALDKLSLNKVLLKLNESSSLTIETLKSITIELTSVNTTLAEFGKSKIFQNEYGEVMDSWITLKLTKRAPELLSIYIELLRAGAICAKLGNPRLKSDAPDELIALLDARVVFPRQWRPARFRRDKVDLRLKERLKKVSTASPSALDGQIKNRQKEFETLTARAKTRESLQVKSRKTYWAFKKKELSARPNATNIPSSRPMPLNENYFTMFNATLTPEEKAELDIIKSENPHADLNKKFSKINADMAPDVLWDDSRKACSDIQVWEKEKRETLPKPNITGLGEERAAIRSVGWGDLIVVRDQLVGYDATEIAHIENVMPGEVRLREKEETFTSEIFKEDETLTETESQTELETSDRQELQTQTEKAIATDFSVSAGVNTSGRYGVTKVDTSLSTDLQRSKSESQSSSTNLAKEIISKAVEKSFESVRELRRSTITKQMRELNRHAIDNSPKEGRDNAPVSHSGVYLWVEKIKELQLHHYGSRLMVEFHIPEPALSLLEQRTLDTTEDIPKPAPFAISPSYVTPATYQCLASLYGVDGVEPPPPLMAAVGKGWNSIPEEKIDADKAEDAFTLELDIPEGYFPSKAVVEASLQVEFEARIPDPAEKDMTLFFSASVGGITGHIQYPAEGDLISAATQAERLEAALAATNNNILEAFKILVSAPITGLAEGAQNPQRLIFENEFDDDYPWPLLKVPVNIRAHGHFDKAMYVQVTIECQRMDETYTNWQLRTWEQIKAGHQVLMSNYNQAVRERNFSDAQLFAPQGRPEKENRQIEREELRKWAIKVMRVESFNFNAVEDSGGIPEISSLAADDQSEIIQFFEETFEWRHMSYLLYPYFWSRRDSWFARQNIEDSDPRHLDFLKAGAARVIVPITPGYEENFLRYLESDAAVHEIERIRVPEKEPVADGDSTSDESEGYPLDTEFENLWLELLLYNNEELARGSGTLTVEQNSSTVVINPNGDQTWKVSPLDIGREVDVAGGTFTIASVSDDKKSFELDREYIGPDNDAMRYAVGSVPYSAPWLVPLPTSHLILSDQKDKLPKINSIGG